MVTIPQANNANSVTTDSFEPAMDNTMAPSSYQYKLYNNILVPDRVVSLGRVVAGNYDAVWLRELMLGLTSADLDVNTVRDAHKHFALARRLSLPGYSYDAMGDMSIQLNFSTLGKALLLHNLSLIHI